MKNYYLLILSSLVLFSACQVTSEEGSIEMGKDGIKIESDEGVVGVGKDGVQITSDEGPAAKMNMQKGDIVLSIDQTFVNTSDELKDILNSYVEGQSFHLNVLRRGSESDSSLTVVLEPDEQGMIGVLLSPISPFKSINKIKLPVGHASYFALTEFLQQCHSRVKF